MMIGVLKQLEIYWDSMDPYNEGWVERLTYDDGHQEFGPAVYPDVTDASLTELQAAVVNLAWVHVIEIREDQVTVYPLLGGGYASWTSALDKDQLLDAMNADLARASDM